MNIDKLTLDTNVLQELWSNRDRKQAVEQLLQLAHQGAVELMVTRRIRDDIPHEPLASRLQELPELQIQERGVVFRLDVSTLDGPDFLGSDTSTQLDAFFAEAQQLATGRIPKRSRANPPDKRDWDHLLAHEALGRDYFLTWDGGILCLRPDLNERFGVVVMKPEDYLAQR
ncbi:MAG: hypothetical protein ACYDAG_14295 [Chloroflexota bacterium]